MRLAATRLGAISQGRGLGSLLWDLAGAAPSLDQRFADDRSLVDAVSGQQLITFSRASDATFVGSNGLIQTAAAGTARFTHDPVTLESLGLLVEEQRTNLLLRSEEFDNPVWTMISGGPAVTANFSVAPDGLQTADGLVFASADRGISQNHTSATVGVVYVASLYIKGVLGETIRLSPLGGIGTATNVVMTGGWQRPFVSGTASSTTVGIQVNTFGGATARNIEVWGAQLEPGAFPTSYIPTVASAVTRTASLADLISSAIANNIRSFYVEFRSPAVGTRGVVSLNDNTANERLAVITSGTDPRLTVHDGGVEQANIDGGTVTANARTRVAVRINENDFAISVNGGAVVTDTIGTLPTVDRLMFGRTQAGEYLNAPIARFTGWTQSLPAGTLQALAQ